VLPYLEIALGLFGLLLALAAFGLFPPFRPLVRNTPRGRVVYAVTAFFAVYLLVSGIRDIVPS
jgi:hypothetical protein